MRRRCWQRGRRWRRKCRHYPGNLHGYRNRHFGLADGHIRHCRADRTVAWELQQCAASRSLEPETTSLLLNPTRSSDWTAQRTAFQQAARPCGQQRIWSWRPEKTWKGPKIGSREARERPEKAALQLAFPSMSPWSLTRARSTSLICWPLPSSPDCSPRQPHQRQHGRLSFSWS